MKPLRPLAMRGGHSSAREFAHAPARRSSRPLTRDFLMVLASSVAGFEPPLQGGLGFPRAPTGEKILYSNILVELRPVNAVAAPDKFPVSLLRRRPMGEPRVPADRNGQGPTIDEIDDQRVVRHPDVLSGGLPDLNWRRSHPMPLAVRPHVLSRALRPSRVPLARTLYCRAAGRDQARPWRDSRRARRVRVAARSDRLNRRTRDTGRIGGPLALRNSTPTRPRPATMARCGLTLAFTCGARSALSGATPR